MAGYFAPDPQATQSPSKGERTSKRDEILLPVTVKQLLNARAHPGEDTFKIDGLEPSKLCIVAQVLKTDVQATCIVLDVADSTGMIQVRLWVDTNAADDYSNMKKGEWIENSYVRVVGYLRQFNGANNLMAFRIHRIENLDEVAFHAAHAAFAHLYHERGGAAAKPFAPPVAAAPVTVGSLQQRVHDYLKARQQQAGGVHIGEICGAFPDSSSDEVSGVVRMLMEEGWVFTGIDEEHFTAGQGTGF